MTIRDEVLSAYLDGELAPEEAERVRTLLARDGDLAQRLERLRLAGELTREAFAPVAATTPALRAAVGLSWRRYAAPVAAAVAACAAGVVLGVSIRGAGAGSILALDDGMIAAPALARALDETPSGASTRTGGVEVRALYSFRDEDARACRVFRAQVSNSATEGAVCRDGAHWRVLALAPTEATEGFMQADTAEPAAIAAVVDEIYAQEIEPAAEAVLIERSWRAGSPDRAGE